MGSDWSSLKRKTDKAAIIEYYGDDKMPMQLRMFAETVYKRGPAGSNGKGMRQMMMKMEESGGRDGEEVMSMMHLGI